MSLKPLRIGLIGAGKTALWHLRAYARIPGARVAAIANPSSPRGEDLARGFSIPRRLRDYRDLLQEDLDAVDICAPTRLHKAMACAALERGLHVYCEKPIACTAAEAEEIAAAGRGRVVFNGFHLRHCPEFARAGEILRSGALGEVRFALLTRTTKEPPGSYLLQGLGAGLFAEFSTHFIDLLLGWGWGDPARILAQGGRVFDHHPDPDTVSINLAYPDGRLAVILNSVGVPGVYPDILVAGTRGVLRLRYGKILLEPQPGRWSLPGLIYQAWRQACVLPFRILYNPFLGSCRHFVECAQTGRPSPHGAREAARSLAIAEAAERSYRDQRAVGLAGGPEGSTLPRSQ